MNKTELIKKLHTYTKVEQQLMQHYEIRNDYQLIKDFNQSLNRQESEEVLAPLISNYIEQEGEALPLVPIDYFFSENDPIKVKVTQHTRYSTPIVHYHNFYEIFYVYEGDFYQTINHQKIHMKSGDICIVTPGVHHSLDVNNYSIVLNLIIENDTLLSYLHNDFRNSAFYAPLINAYYFQQVDNPFYIIQTFGDTLIQDIFLTIYLETLNQESAYPSFVHSSILQLLGLMERQYQKEALVYDTHKNQEIFDFQLLKCIEQEYATLTLGTLADKFNYSPQFISNRIKQLTGKTFSQFLIDKRLAVACQLLEHTGLKVKDISMKVGFQNEEHFSRTFKKAFHATPLAYRKNFHTFKTE